MSEDKKTTKERVSKHQLVKQLQSKRKDAQPRSKRYLAAEAALENPGTVTLAEAIALVKKTATTKFDGSLELHVHLTAKKGKKGAEDEFARGMVRLPHGMGKVRRVVVLDEAMVETIAKTGTIDFDIALATPALMPKLGKVAKILGTKGKMPNPKAGTVTDNPEDIKAQIEAGRVEFRQDSGRNVHQMIGKVSWDDDKLVENAQAVLAVFTKNRLAGVSVTSTMGPAVRVNIDTISK